MNKLFVGGFPLEITELELAQLVGTYGDIATLKIVYDRKTRFCKGYAFVEMQTMDDAVNAAAMLDGTTIGGRQLTVNLVEEKLQLPQHPNARFTQANKTADYKRPDTASDEFKKKRPRKPMF